MRSLKPLFFLIVIALFAVSYFTNRGEYPRPTEAFYVNDFAGVLMQGTRATIRNEGERLYEWTQDEVDGGAQVVIATFEVENAEDTADYDRTEIYRQWKIGDNDMGLLVLFFFVQNETTEELELVEAQYEAGYHMEQYLTPVQMLDIMNDSIFNEEWDWLFDMSVVKMLYDILTVLYVDVYGYSSFDYDMDVYFDYLMDYVPEEEITITPMNVFIYLLSPYSTGWEKTSALLPFILLMLFGGSSAVLGNRGGGGSSGGMGLIFRRRR